ncbi:MAG TPA: hypothetical protein VN089_10580, partial [Duganella sp.]|nr:hypothetical protein [Duganella sp.]
MDIDQYSAQTNHLPPAGDLQPGQAASAEHFFAHSPYFAFSIDEGGALLWCNGHTRGALGPVADKAPAASLYATWSVP